MAFLRFLTALVLMAPVGDGTDGGAGGASSDPPAAGATGATGPAEPFAVFHSQKALDERLRRASRSQLREMFGTDDEDVIKARWAKADELEKAEQARIDASKTELQRKEDELRAEKKRADDAATALEQERLDRHIAEQCAKHGIKNTTYASFLILEGSKTLGQGEQLDVGEFLAKQLESDATKAALGLAAPVEQVRVPVSTSPEPGAAGGAPPPPGTPPPVKTSMDMSPDEWQRKRQELGI
jgi:hypothetical protein